MSVFPAAVAIDRTAWLRPHAPTLKERTYEHQPTALPMPAYLSASVARSGYDRTNTGDEQELGAAASDTNALPVGTIRSVLALNNRQQVCQYLQNRPITVFDSEYGCAPLIKATADEPRPIN